MEITNIRDIKGSPYKTKKQISEDFGISPQTVQNRIRDMEKESERYGRYAIIRDGGIVLVNYLAIIDFMRYREQLADSNAKKYVPAYEPRDVAKSIGWYAD